MTSGSVQDPAQLIPRELGRYSPVFVERGEGCYVWDRAGDRWLDFTAGIGVTNTGHCHPKVVAAIREQAGKIIHAQANIFIHTPMLQAAEALTGTLPESLDQVFFANSGAEAVEGAIKLAKTATRRPAIVAFRGAFHGRTHAAMAVTTSKVKTRAHYEPMLPSVYYAPYPYVFRSPYKGPPEDADLWFLRELEHLFATTVLPEDVAAIVMETVAGEGGYIVPPARFMRNLRALCDEHGILLILDEIQSGMGRTGAMWAFEHFDVVPDIMTSAKGLASGMPVSAIVASKRIMDAWSPGAHGTTYGGNAVGTAAAVATFEVIKSEHLVKNAATMGARMLTGLRDVQRDYPVIGDVRGLGLMIATEFVTPDGGPNTALAQKVIEKCWERKLLLISCGTWEQCIRIIPPLIVTGAQIDEFLDTFRWAVSSVA